MFRGSTSRYTAIIGYYRSQEVSTTIKQVDGDEDKKPIENEINTAGANIISDKQKRRRIGRMTFCNIGKNDRT